jgi:hypothetical protein
VAVEELEIVFKDGVSAAADSAAKSMEGLVNSFTKAIVPTFSVNDAVGWVKDNLKEFAVAAWDAAKAMVGMAIDASEFKAETLSAFSALEGGPAAAEATLNALRDLEKVLPQNEKTLADWSRGLLAAGVSSDKLKGALTAVSGASLLVQGGGDKVVGLLKKWQEASIAGTKIKFSTSMLAGTGVTEEEFMHALGMTPKQLDLAKKQGTLTGEQLSDALVKVLNEKGAGPIATSMNKLSTIWDKFKDNVIKLFEDVDISPFIDALKDLLGIFDQGTDSGKAMKEAITATFNKIFQVAAKVIPYIKEGFKILAILILKTYIALKPVGAALVKLWDAVSQGKGGNETMAEFALIMARCANMISMFAERATFAIGVVTKLVTWYDQAKTAGTDLAQGLVDGVNSGVGWVVDAVRGMGASAISALKGVLHISSPSRIMKQMGHFTAEGFAGGMDAGTGKVEASAGKMAGAAVGGAAGGVGGGGKGGVTVNLAAGAIQVTGASGDVSELTENAVSLMFERIALTQGLGA